MLPRKVALHTSSHLTPIEAWRSTVSTTSEGRRVSSEVRLENCTQVWGLGQIWTGCDSQLRKNSASHVFWLIQTCRNLSEPVRKYSDHVSPSRNVIFCNFECSYSSVLRRILVKLYILTRLIESFPMVYGLWRCIEVKLSIPLGAHAYRPSKERASSAVIFKSYVLSFWKMHISTQLIDSFPLTFCM